LKFIWIHSLRVLKGPQNTKDENNYQKQNATSKNRKRYHREKEQTSKQQLKENVSVLLKLSLTFALKQSGSNFHSFIPIQTRKGRKKSRPRYISDRKLSKAKHGIYVEKQAT
jgi:hypothetical protein